MPDFLPEFIRPPVFELGVADLDQLPDSSIPEVCLAGRSNVGKSSLTNALFGRSDVARVSNTPGRTQQLNVFNVDGKFRLIDMPGYGYAKVSKTQKAAWDDLVFAYLRGRPNLKRVFVLMDSRHPLQKADVSTMDVLDKAAVSYQIVMTKGDELKPKETEAMVAKVRDALKKRPACHPEILLSSSRTGAGIVCVQQALVAAALV